MDSPPLDLATAAARYPGGVVAIGTFDGVHLAHRALVARARARADAAGVPVVVLTFEPHPKEVLLRKPPPRLTGPEEKSRRLLDAGADAVCALEFDREMQGTSCRDFVDHVLGRTLKARACLVGYNFSFGEGGRGRPEDLARLAAEREIEVEVLAALDVDGIPVSSTAIRTLVACGDVVAAKERLGARHLLSGTVQRGAGRGRDLGFPTANLAVEPPTLLVPRRGVYWGWARMPRSPEGRAPPTGENHRRCTSQAPAASVADRQPLPLLPALANIGVNPTFRGEDPPPGEAAASKVEVFVPDHDGSELYGQRLGIELEDRLRDERRFEDAEELVEQLHRDLGELRARISRRGP